MKIINKKIFEELIQKNKLIDFQDEMLKDIENHVSFLIKEKIKK